MDGIGIIVFFIAGGVYFATERKYPILAFLSGVGAGMVVGLLYAASVVNRMVP